MRTEQTIGSLFSGIGGIDLAFERAGFRIAWQVESDDYCQAVLNKHWPGVPKHKDMHDVGRTNLSPVDVIAGGFPCQPVSVAGQRKAQDDERWLWSQFARIVGELRPRFVFLENVPGILTCGGIDVLNDLAALGYDAEWGTVAAADVGAPHRRERWFCVAYADSARLAQWQSVGGNTRQECSPAIRAGRTPAKPGMGRVLDGLSARLDGSTHWPARPGQRQKVWEPSRIVRSGTVPHRAARLKALGNAVVPQVVYPFACAIRDWLICD